MPDAAMDGASPLQEAATRPDPSVVPVEDGQPLPVDDGPLRLVVPSDKRPARWVRQVVRIVVSDVPDTATRVPDTADHPPVAK